jgi:hypothetical protein
MSAGAENAPSPTAMKSKPGSAGIVVAHLAANRSSGKSRRALARDDAMAAFSWERKVEARVVGMLEEGMVGRAGQRYPDNNI